LYQISRYRAGGSRDNARIFDLLSKQTYYTSSSFENLFLTQPIVAY
jgi:hypothetical protein